ncbi:alpha/beta fold hydrolase [Nonomuraea sp. LP-02]|uniref:alpha/beta hydrolase n=1 Tax=Nonomuraea sp. LP-02 TaxID=3097960 RepID=UPI003FA61171
MSQPPARARSHRTCTTSCASASRGHRSRRRSEEAGMRVVFVHGACVRDGAWWWHRAADDLRNHGILSSAPPLPSCGETGIVPTGEGPTLEDDVAAVRAWLAADEQPAIVVGHSYGGVVAGAAAPRPPHGRFCRTATVRPWSRRTRAWSGRALPSSPGRSRPPPGNTSRPPTSCARRTTARPPRCSASRPGGPPTWSRWRRAITPSCPGRVSSPGCSLTSPEPGTAAPSRSGGPRRAVTSGAGWVACRG